MPLGCYEAWRPFLGQGEKRTLVSFYRAAPLEGRCFSEAIGSLALIGQGIAAQRSAAANGPRGGLTKAISRRGPFRQPR